MTSNWNDFNDAEQQQGFDLIPKGTLVPVRMTIKPGGHDDPAQGWVGGYATEPFETGAIYLAAEFIVTGGEHATLMFSPITATPIFGGWQRCWIGSRSIRIPASILASCPYPDWTANGSTGAKDC